MNSINDNVFIDEPLVKHEDRIIRRVYTPREVVHSIREEFMGMSGGCNLTRSEQLLLINFCNNLIGGYRYED